MITPNCSTAYKLLCQGENALSQVSVNGFKIDRDYYMKQKPLPSSSLCPLPSSWPDPTPQPEY